ncbi:hypothetical protein OIU84_024191 [Salix udensis]|uniref:Uncharacterized protein n=1 Tax=Salix udensis TaxID=889485 RepID=A0AAD6PBQ5_9ROSI|nr:hypothetical protein OIU84_024191 [Salix udensis]
MSPPTLFSGPIPQYLGECRSLEILDLCTNKFQGEFPAHLCAHLTLLSCFYFCENYIFGEISREIGNLTSLEELVIYSNNLTGHNSCINPLEILRLAQNSFQGSLPKELQKLQNLTNLILEENILSGEIPPKIGNISNQEVLALHENFFRGFLPKELGKLSQLKELYIYWNINYLEGHIPYLIGYNSNLSVLDIADSNLVGNIPPYLCKYEKLMLLGLGSNWLFGNIHPLWSENLQNLSTLDMYQNRFSGSIPPWCRQAREFEEAALEMSLVTWEIAWDFGGLILVGTSSQTERAANGRKSFFPVPYLSSSANFIVFKLVFNISHNRLSGTIPNDLGKLQMLESLYLNDNQLVGDVPTSFSELISLLVCNLSNNNLVGPVPNNPAFLRMDSTNFAGYNDPIFYV